MKNAAALGRKKLKNPLLRPVLAGLALVSLAMFTQAGCGGSSKKSTTASTASLVKKRVFVLNQTTGAIQIVDFSKDELTSNSITVAGRPQIMGFTSTSSVFVYENLLNTFYVIDEAKEAQTGAIALPAQADSVVSSPTAAYAAMGNAGEIGVVTIANATETNVAVPLFTRRLVLSHNNSKLLAFTDNSNSMTILNTADNSLTTVSGLDRPYSAIFSSDDSKAYIFNCGAECGGTQASVAILDMASATVTNTLPVRGATTGVSDGTNIYVAGNDYTGGTFNGAFVTEISQSGFTKSLEKNIGFGLHTTAVVTGNGKIYIGASNCVNPSGAGSSGCLSMFTPGGAVAMSAADGDVVSIQPIKGRNVAYVIEGGELRIYDTTADTLQPKQIDIIGKAVDALEID